MKKRLIIAFLVCYGPFALCHQTSDSFLSINKGISQLSDGKWQEEWQGEWRVPLDVLDTLYGNELALDQNSDQKITWGELSLSEALLTNRLLSTLLIRHDGQPCRVKKTDFQLDDLNTGLYLYLPFIIKCQQSGPGITIDYQLFFEQDPLHRGFLKFTDQQTTSSFVFSPDSPSVSLKNHSNSVFAGYFQINSFIQYIREGIWHIWIGLDHILFLLALLIPSVFIFKGGQRQTHERFKPMLKDVLTVVTGFTLAHSITLTLATLKVISLPGVLVETVIAISVALSGLMMFFARFYRYRWQVAGGFGLIHGFGFASVLVDLNLPLASFSTSLFAFNIGVEIGQLAIVSAMLPIMYLMRKNWFYHRVVLPFSACVMVTYGTIWMFERGLNIQLV